MRRFYTLMVFWIVCASATLIAEERTVREKQLADAELRIKSIYEKRTFTPGAGVA